jgi:hypothetical protein
MKFFTHDLRERYGSTDDSAIAQQAEREWEEVNERYEQHLGLLEPSLPPHLREFLELRLQDAIVWSIARQGQQLVLIARKDIPPRDVVIINWTLTAEPVIDREALPGPERSAVMAFVLDEFDVLQSGERPVYQQAILFSNSWEMKLEFSDVRVQVAEPLYAGATGWPGQPPEEVVPRSA